MIMTIENTGFPPLPPKKSEKLNPEEKKALRKFLAQYDTRVEAAREVELSPTTLYNVELKGCGAPDTIAKIRKAINIPA